MYVSGPMLIYTTERILTLYDRNYKVEINKVRHLSNDFQDVVVFLLIWECRL